MTLFTLKERLTNSMALKKFELLGNDGGTDPHECGYTRCLSPYLEDLIPFLNYQLMQVGLETFIILYYYESQG